MKTTKDLRFAVAKLALTGTVREAYSAGQGNVERGARESDEEYEARAHDAGVEAIWTFLDSRGLVVTLDECGALISDIGA